MIVSGISWRRARRGVAAVALLPLIGGCSLLDLISGGPPAPPPEPLPPPRTETGTRTDNAAGLETLPSSQQVLAAVPFGRTDPFAPLAAASPAAAASSAQGPASGQPSGTAQPGAAAAQATAAAQAMAAARKALAGFQLTGVIHSGHTAEALVTFGTLSGSLKPGDRGGRTTPLLPPGWRLETIRLAGTSPDQPASITLVGAGQRLRIAL